MKTREQIKNEIVEKIKESKKLGFDIGFNIVSASEPGYVWPKQFSNFDYYEIDDFDVGNKILNELNISKIEGIVANAKGKKAYLVSFFMSK